MLFLRRVTLMRILLLTSVLVFVGTIVVYSSNHTHIQNSYDSIKNGISNWNPKDKGKSDSNTEINNHLIESLLPEPEDSEEFKNENPNDEKLAESEYGYFNEDDEYNVGAADYKSETDPSFHDDWDEKKKTIMKFISEDSADDTTLTKRTNFFANVFKLISDYKPDIEPLDKYLNDKCGVQGVNEDARPVYSKEQLSKYLQVSKDDVKNLKENHDTFVSLLPEFFPNNIYTPDSNGIVYVGGDRFSWLTLLSIMNLRQIGSKLPVEVLIPKFEEYELEICSKVFPRYNAKCIYLPRLVGESVFQEYKFKGYQYKSLALALSSFENALLLDADNTPLKDPEYLFSTAPFTDTGLVLWPDFWKRTTAPSYYEIIGKEVDESKRRDFGYREYGKKIQKVTPDGEALLHQLENTMPDPSTESGQVMFSKKKHFKSLLLSLYYNTHGPDYYYPILSQGAAGEGDKETFIAAAHAVNEDYYTVKKHVSAIGRFRNGDFHGSAMGQYNSAEDFEIFETYKDSEEDVQAQPSMLFLHINFPKLDPWSLYVDDVIIDKANDHQRNRLFGNDFINTAKYDFELQTWLNMKQLLCDEKLEFTNFKNREITTSTVCHEVLQQIDFLENSLVE